MNTLPPSLAFGIGPIGWTELLVILVIGLLIFGRRLPEVGRNFGKSIVEFKRGLKGIEHEIEEESSKPALPKSEYAKAPLTSSGEDPRVAAGEPGEREMPKQSPA